MTARPVPTPPAPREQAEIDAVHTRLRPIWKNEPGLWGWLTSVNHKSIALRSIITAFVFFALAGVEAAMMRAQLARPENSLIGPDKYNQLFTVHGSTMMFLFAVPIVQSVALYFVFANSVRRVSTQRANELAAPARQRVACVTVTQLEQRTLGPDRDVQRRPRDQLLVVEIPGVDSRRSTVHSAR